MNLLSSVLQNGAVLQQMAKQLNLDPNQVQSAVTHMIPALTRGIQKNASSPGGLEGLLGALQKGSHSQYVEKPNLLGQAETINDGNAILGHILGSKDVSRNVAGHAARLATPGEVEDVVTFSFRSQAGVPGTAAYNFASHAKEDVMELAGSAGRIAFSVFGHEPIRLETPRGIEQFEFAPPPHIAQPLIQTVVDDLLGRGACPSTGESARRTNVVMDRVLAAYYGGRYDDFWMRPATWPGRRDSETLHSSP